MLLQVGVSVSLHAFYQQILGHEEKSSALCAFNRSTYLLGMRKPPTSLRAFGAADCTAAVLLMCVDIMSHGVHYTFCPERCRMG
jgi:hypothetical protein